jgi:hypothetical protein
LIIYQKSLNWYHWKLHNIIMLFYGLNFKIVIVRWSLYLSIKKKIYCWYLPNKYKVGEPHSIYRFEFYWFSLICLHFFSFFHELQAQSEWIFWFVCWILFEDRQLKLSYRLISVEIWELDTSWILRLDSMFKSAICIGSCVHSVYQGL